MTDQEIKADLALGEVLSGIEEQNRNREKNIERFKEDLRIQQDLDKKREDRIRRQQEIAEVAANDIRDSSLIKWRKLLVVHKFLSSFLKLKMQREIKKYSGVEEAFQKIKAATGVNDANEIVKKFLGREQTYSHLLISIAEYEKRIDVFKQQNDELKQQLETLKSENGNVFMDNYKENRDVDQDKQLMEIEDKSLLSTLLQKKLDEWIEKNLVKLQRANIIEETNRETSKQGFNDILAALKQLLSLSKERNKLHWLGPHSKTTAKKFTQLTSKRGMSE